MEKKKPTSPDWAEAMLPLARFPFVSPFVTSNGVKRFESASHYTTGGLVVALVLLAQCRPPCSSNLGRLGIFAAFPSQHLLPCLALQIRFS